MGEMNRKQQNANFANKSVPPRSRDFDVVVRVNCKGGQLRAKSFKTFCVVAFSSELGKFFGHLRIQLLDNVVSHRPITKLSQSA